MRYFSYLFIAFLVFASQPVMAQVTESVVPHPRQQEAIKIAVDWLDLVESGDDEQSYAGLAPIFQRNLTPEAWQKAVIERNIKAGKRLSRKLRRVVWYDNPIDAPLPGLYAAIEFDSVFENTDKHFQYITLHSQNGAPFKVMRNELTVTLKKAGASDQNTR